VQYAFHKPACQEHSCDWGERACSAAWTPLVVERNEIPLAIGKSEGVLSVLSHAKEDPWDREASALGFWTDSIIVGSYPFHAAAGAALKSMKIAKNDFALVWYALRSDTRS